MPCVFASELKFTCFLASKLKTASLRSPYRDPAFFRPAVKIRVPGTTKTLKGVSLSQGQRPHISLIEPLLWASTHLARLLVLIRCTMPCCKQPQLLQDHTSAQGRNNRPCTNCGPSSRCLNGKESHEKSKRSFHSIEQPRPEVNYASKPSQTVQFGTSAKEFFLCNVIEGPGVLPSKTKANIDRLVEGAMHGKLTSELRIKATLPFTCFVIRIMC